MVIEVVGTESGAVAECLDLANPLPPLAGVGGSLTLHCETEGPHRRHCRAAVGRFWARAGVAIPGGAGVVRVDPAET